MEAETYAAVGVRLPELLLDGWSGWLCKVCRRELLPNRQPWSWFACEHCRAVDAKAASLFGSKRILPLGQHSIMNGVGIRLSTVNQQGVVAQFDRFSALGRGWRDLDEWAGLEGHRLVEAIPEVVRGDLVSIIEWQRWFPPSIEASADAYARHISQFQPWLSRVEPWAADAVWLQRQRVPSVLEKHIPVDQWITIEVDRRIHGTDREIGGTAGYRYGVDALITVRCHACPGDLDERGIAVSGPWIHRVHLQRDARDAWWSVVQEVARRHRRSERHGACRAGEDDRKDVRE